MRRVVGKHAGHEVKTMGDGFMVAFGSAQDAIRCGIELQDAFYAHNAKAVTPVQVRIGLHTGELIRDADDFFGHHVNVAARIGDAANAEEVLVSRVVRDLAGPTTEFTFADRGEHELRGIEGRFELMAVKWERDGEVS